MLCRVEWKRVKEINNFRVEELGFLMIMEVVLDFCCYDKKEKGKGGNVIIIKL